MCWEGESNDYIKARRCVCLGGERLGGGSVVVSQRGVQTPEAASLIRSVCAGQQESRGGVGLMEWCLSDLHLLHLTAR